MRGSTGAVLGVVMLAGSAFGGGGAGAGPDIVVGAIGNVNGYGPVSGVRAYSAAFTLCNMGDAPVGYSVANAQHPIVTQNLYRMYAGGFEQIGMGWCFNTTFPLEQAACSVCTPSGNPMTLGVGCSDAHTASVAGNQSSLSRRSEVDPAGGMIAFPQDGIGATGDAVFKRLQAHESAFLVPGARYFIELHAVAPDDAAAGNQHNNASWREVTVAPNFSMTPIGGTMVGSPAIEAWASAAGATVAAVDVPGDGRVLVGSLATNNGDGTWTYSYAIENLSSERGVGSLAVPTGGSIMTQIGFHSAGYHSGEPFDNAAWGSETAGGEVVWATEPYATNQDANAVRWAMMHTFKFVSSRPPTNATARLGLFAPGGGGGGVDEVFASVRAPSCAADLAEPVGVLNFFDIQAYIGLYNAQDPAADLAAPVGVFNFFDIQTFVGLFNAGCP